MDCIDFVRTCRNVPVAIRRGCIRSNVLMVRAKNGAGGFVRNTGDRDLL